MLYLNHNSKLLISLLLIFRILPAYAILALGFVISFITFAFEMRSVKNIKVSQTEGISEESRVRIGKNGGQGNDGGREGDKDWDKGVSSVKEGWTME